MAKGPDTLKPFVTAIEAPFSTAITFAPWAAALCAAMKPEAPIPTITTSTVYSSSGPASFVTLFALKALTSPPAFSTALETAFMTAMLDIVAPLTTSTPKLWLSMISFITCFSTIATNSGVSLCSVILMSVIFVSEKVVSTLT